MSELASYIGPLYFLNLKKAHLKDNYLDFESKREKNIGNLNYKNLMIGPILSVDKTSLLYIYKKFNN